MINLGVIGYGYWGPNIVRNFNSTDESKIVYLCDLESNNLKRAQKTYPNLKLSMDYRDITLLPFVRRNVCIILEKLMTERWF